MAVGVHVFVDVESTTEGPGVVVICLAMSCVNMSKVIAEDTVVVSDVVGTVYNFAIRHLDVPTSFEV